MMKEVVRSHLNSATNLAGILSTRMRVTVDGESVPVASDRAQHLLFRAFDIMFKCGDAPHAIELSRQDYLTFPGQSEPKGSAWLGVAMIKEREAPTPERAPCVGKAETAQGVQ